MKHLKYLRYVLRHKRFVFHEGRKLGVPIFQLLAHDLSKFRPDEWAPYADYFYGTGTYKDQDGFDRAWLLHQHRNPHHWQFWVLREDSGAETVLRMPDRYAREMLADWRGAGRAINGKDETAAWYRKTEHARRLHPLTRAWVEAQLGLEAAA